MEYMIRRKTCIFLRIYKRNTKSHCQLCREIEWNIGFQYQCISIYIYLLKPKTQLDCNANFLTRCSVIIGIVCNIVCFCRLPKVASDISAEKFIVSYICQHWEKYKWIEKISRFLEFIFYEKIFFDKICIKYSLTIGVNPLRIITMNFPLN